MSYLCTVINHHSMNTTKEKAYARLTENGIKPSVQRMAIMEFLMENFTHPTIEDIYQALHPIMPTLSKTTVYNTMRLFAEYQAAQVISIDDHHICYDGNITPHAHYYCDRCGKIIDLYDVPVPRLRKTTELQGHDVNSVQLYYRGVCKDCKKNEN